MTIEEKKKARKEMKEQTNKDLGECAVMSMSDKPIEKIDVISTGSFNLDIALGVGGLPRGRVVEIYGPESSGKTTLAIHVMANAQKNGGLAGFIDVEHAFDSQYAVDLGVNIDDLDISQPDYGEMALEVADRMVSSGVYDVVVVDSVAALVPKKELEGQMGESAMGVMARLMSQALRKLTATVSKTNTCLIFINQLREKIGVQYGSPEVTTGGNALKYYASIRLDIRRYIHKDEDKIVEDGEMVGNKTKVRVIKNKVAPPFKTAIFDIMYGKGINSDGEILDLAVDMDIIHKAGSWYSCDGNKLGQGAKTVEKAFQDNPGFFEDIKRRVIEQIKNKD